eukprot:6848001-Lingulodinium_polyedra.AAC.1
MSALKTPLVHKALSWTRKARGRFGQASMEQQPLMQPVAFCQGEMLHAEAKATKPSVTHIPGSKAAQQEESSSSDEGHRWGNRLAWAKAKAKAAPAA